MIQVGTFLKVVDNSGAKIIECIKVVGGYRQRYALLGGLILVSVKLLRKKRRATSKVKKGEVHLALVLRNCSFKKTFCGNKTKFFLNSAVLLNKQKKLLGSRIFGPLSKSFRYTQFLKLLTMCNGELF